MPRARIVLDTSDQHKSALIEAASLQGASLADWFEEQVAITVPQLVHGAPSLQELQDPAELQDTATVLAGLRKQDWAFTDDDTRYLTHDLHPYPAKFIPQIPATLIARLSMRGDVICDPFGGSATTAVEAVRLGRRAISLDANPLGALIGKVKTGFMDSSVRRELKQLAAAIEGHTIEPSNTQPVYQDDESPQYKPYVPDIPNIDRWFTPHAIRELALLRHLISRMTNGLSRDAAQLALSRIILRVSNQESETRYVAVAKAITPSLTFRAYLESLKTVIRRLESATVELQFADAKFLTVDSRGDLTPQLPDNSVDLIVTSPPYPNATDYHLYHRFRLFWLGHDPRLLGNIEIGSHLRHQRNNTGFEEYRADMANVLRGCERVLQPGRYAVFVVGDAMFKGENFSTASAITAAATEAGLVVLGIIDRPIHNTKRSFAKPARRARSEQLVILYKPNRPIKIQLTAPAYKMWPYERNLRLRETEALTSNRVSAPSCDSSIELPLKQPELWHARRLTFTRELVAEGCTQNPHPTWQKVLENGDSDSTKRKDPKYATHGLHPYKGKFYPQLAKALLNISGTPVGSKLFDPFCGSGTTLLEGMLNGYATFGCDFNPLAARISAAKTSILTVPRNITEDATLALLERVRNPPNRLPQQLDQFPKITLDELQAWFPPQVLHKTNWLLEQIRLFGRNILSSFFEIVLSSLIREVSHQEPKDLRIRRRKTPLTDAPVLELFSEKLSQQHNRLRKFWLVAGRQPGRLITPQVRQGDSRTHDTLDQLGLMADSVDCVITSPPYATALPYIDTDRLSIAAIIGIPTSERMQLEQALTGTREIRKGSKSAAEAALLSKSAFDELPRSVVSSLRHIYSANAENTVGFRRDNMPALLWRYFLDMKHNLAQVHRVLKPRCKAFYVVGDSRTKAGSSWFNIQTCQHICEIGKSIGLDTTESIAIDVTTENYNHLKNAITENQIIIFQKN